MTRTTMATRRTGYALGVSLIAVFALTIPSASGCSEREDTLRNCDVPALFQSSCDGGLCHGTSLPQADLDLVSPGVDHRLFHIPGTSSCDERKLVVPGHPEQSLLYIKVSEEEPFCGSPMPLDRHLSPDELACLRDYIETAGTDTDGKDCPTCGTLLCVDFSRDPLNCGACDQACAEGMVCGDGECLNPCADDEILCGASCVRLDDNDNHCGTCSHRCAPGSSCQSGVCQCASDDDGAGGFGGSLSGGATPSFSTDIVPLFDASCASTLCHLAGDLGTPPVLSAEFAYANLLDVSAVDCSGRKYVVPNSPDQSYLLEKLMGGELCAGERMPLSEDALPDAAILGLTRWICAGAPDN